MSVGLVTADALPQLMPSLHDRRGKQASAQSPVKFPAHGATATAVGFEDI